MATAFLFAPGRRGAFSLVYTQEMPKLIHAKREIEIKLRVNDVPAVVRSLGKLGAAAEGRVLERNVLYDTPDSYFRRTGRLLRLRIETPAASGAVKAGTAAALVTFKAPVPVASHSRYKEKLESELAITMPGDWEGRLRAIGFKPGFQYEKYRSSFRVRGVQVCLDETPIGAFLELEGIPATIDRVARRLGYRPREYIRGTYWDLYAADCTRRGKSPQNLLFRA